MKISCPALLFALLPLCAAAETYSLNADWKFAKATKSIPLSQAKSSVETSGVNVEDPEFDDSSWETVSVPHPINAHFVCNRHGAAWEAEGRGREGQRILGGRYYDAFKSL